VVVPQRLADDIRQAQEMMQEYLRTEEQERKVIPVEGQ
jgi:hypothetical protein